MKPSLFCILPLAIDLLLQADMHTEVRAILIAETMLQGGHICPSKIDDGCGNDEIVTAGC